MNFKPMLVAAAITLTPVAAFAQGSAGSSAATDTTRSRTSNPNNAVNTNCSPGVTSQRSAANSAMNNKNATGNSANCDTSAGNPADSSSAMTNRNKSSTPSPGR